MSAPRLGGGEVHLSGFFIFAVVMMLMAAAKVTVLDTWSWWRVSLPLAAYVGFNAAYIISGLIYLSVARLPEHTEDEEADLDEGNSTHRWISMLFFVVFADNVVRWFEGTEAAYWFWLLSGTAEAVVIFGVLSVLNLFLYWSTIGKAVRGLE